MFFRFFLTLAGQNASVDSIRHSTLRPRIANRIVNPTVTTKDERRNSIAFVHCPSQAKFSGDVIYAACCTPRRRSPSDSEKKVKVVHKGLRIRSGLPRETNEKIEKERKIEKKRTTQ